MAESKRRPRTSSLPRSVHGCRLGSTRHLEFLGDDFCLSQRVAWFGSGYTRIWSFLSPSPLFLAVTSPEFLRQILEAFGIIPHFQRLLHLFKQVCFLLRAARNLSMCLPLVSAPTVVQTTGRFKFGLFVWHSKWYWLLKG